MKDQYVTNFMEEMEGYIFLLSVYLTKYLSNIVKWLGKESMCNPKRMVISR